MEELKKNSLDKNTIVVFTSDNGPWLPFEELSGSAGLLRNGKGTSWEGGHRVPGIFWGGPIKKGMVDQLGSTLDIFPTILEMLGVENNTKVQALGGGKNHMIVLPDADLDMAADAAVSASFGAAGQRCMAVSVVVAVGDIADDLVKKIKERMPNLVIGKTDKSETQLGPVISQEIKDKIFSGFGLS